MTAKSARRAIMRQLLFGKPQNRVNHAVRRPVEILALVRNPASSYPSSAMARAAPASIRRSFLTALKIMIYVALVGLLALIVAVAVAYANLPSYSQLAKRSDLGQMVRVRAANGAVLVNIGPSFGQWLPYEQIPEEMRAAMIAVEDRRFRSHLGVDPIGSSAPPRFVSPRPLGGSGRTSTITQQLARNVFLTTTARSTARSRKPCWRWRSNGSSRRTRSSSSTSTGLFRRRRLWHRLRSPKLLQPSRAQSLASARLRSSPAW